MGLIFGLYSVSISVLGGIIGDLTLRRFWGGKNVLILALVSEVLLFICYIHQSFYEIQKIYLVALFLVSVMLINLKFISLYSLGMESTWGEQAGVFRSFNLARPF